MTEEEQWQAWNDRQSYLGSKLVKISGVNICNPLIYPPSELTEMSTGEITPIFAKKKLRIVSKPKMQGIALTVSKMLTGYMEQSRNDIIKNGLK